MYMYNVLLEKAVQSLNVNSLLETITVKAPLSIPNILQLHVLYRQAGSLIQSPSHVKDNNSDLLEPLQVCGDLP